MVRLNCPLTLGEAQLSDMMLQEETVPAESAQQQHNDKPPAGI
jgi:hypothetical protein